MSDSETPRDDPQPQDAANPSAETANGGPGEAAPSTQPTQRPQFPAGSDGLSGPGSRIGPLAAVRRATEAPRLVWGVLAAACVAVGVAASLLGAHALARHDEAQARQSFHLSVTSTGIASSVSVALAHEEDLVDAASTFFTANPTASPAELAAWARWTRALGRYPELQRLGFVAFVKPPDTTDTTTATTAAGASRRTSPLTTRTSAASLGALPVVPSSKPSCAPSAQLSRTSPAGSAVRGSRCSLTHGLLSARDTGRRYSSFAPHKDLSIVVPVYRGGVTPSSLAGRRAAFVGWLREVLSPGVVMGQALRGHPRAAVRLRYHAGSTNLVFRRGAPQSHAQSLATNLHDGWTVRSFGPAAGASLFAHGNALAVMIAGVILSILAGLLVFFLGTTRPRAASAVAAGTRPEPQQELYDPLTGLPNRALMLDRAQRMLARAGRQSGLLIGALFVDIDWFKDVSDKIGGSAGDQLLKIVAERLEGVVRTQDSVGRLDGDEFVVLVESAARGARLESLARRIIEALHKPVGLDDFGPSFVVTASIGVAFGRYATADDLLRDARLAMHAAKAAGKDRYTLFNANMRSVTESRATLEAELNTALHEGQFFLLYEPIYDLGTGKVVGLEADVRWRHRTRGVVAPAEFMALAEETGLSVPIGRWMLEEACGRAAAWSVAGHRLAMSVGVSANQLNRDGFATDVRRALQQSGIEPSLLILEISEDIVMRDIAGASHRLSELKRLGVRIAIDDFGSGYAYHSDLQQLPVDFLTVNRSSLAASDDEDYRRWLLEAILVLGRDLSLAVIAKGVDSPEQLASLRSGGCSMAQGPLLGQPTPVEHVERLFDTELPAAPSAAMAPDALSAPAPRAAPAAPVAVPAAAAPGPAGPQSPAGSPRSHADPPPATPGAPPSPADPLR